ncbi:MAG: protein kinase [Streptosporangiaceae bacterium]|nr:protein kinase [Streptosporangiaceae bacterium]MBV9855566.1 protein kinase [Streptosporangiaceae bacterium]
MTDGKRRLAGRYRIDGLLGRGGMSEVYFGYDERLDRPVAVKLLRPPSYVPGSPDSPEAVEILDALDRDQRRFLREIRMSARLELVGVPAVYDTGVDDLPDGTRQLWLVMQLLRGSTLETLLDGASFSGSDTPGVAWAVAVAAQIAAVLADVHRVDIVHRDIKAANVMVTDGGLVKVLDFGIAILRGAGALPRLTQVDRTVGTPAYMSPEQWAGQLVTPASDVYSLGCLLFELLTGDMPFHGSSRMPLRVAHQECAVPSAAAARKSVPPAVDKLVAAMLAKDPAARPAAEAVYRALLPIAAGTVAVADGPLPGGEERRDPVRPFRQPLLGPMGRDPFRVPAGGKAADGGSGTGTTRPLTEDEAIRLRADVQVLLDGENPSDAIRLLEAGLGRAVPGSALELQIRRTLAAALLIGGQYRRAAQLFEQAGTAYRQHLGAADPWALDCAYQAGHAYAQAGKPGKALPQLRYYVMNAVPLAARDADEAAKVMESRFVIAQLLASIGEIESAITELRAIRPLLAAAYGPESAQVRNLDRQAARLRPAPGKTF